MTSADRPIQRPPAAKLLVIDDEGRLTHARRASFVEHFLPGDLVVANDAATLPASLHGTHDPTGRPIEVRLAGRRSLAADDVHVFAAVVFGAGDYHIRTEDRPPPPPLSRGDGLTLGALTATILSVGRHPRLVTIGFRGSVDAVWAGLAHHGRPIQYAHIDTPLALWDVWTPVAGTPAAFEPPSAGFALDWRSVGGAARPRRRIRHHHACGRHLVDRRRLARCDAALRRAVRDSVGNGDRRSPTAGKWRPRGCRRHDGGSRARACG